VREVEEMVRNIKEGATTKAAAEKKSADKKQDAVFHQLKKQLTNFFQTPVQMTCSAKGSGKISIKFKNEKELERIISIFDRLNK
jgi:ParB family chromosome partitioning protein